LAVATSSRASEEYLQAIYTLADEGASVIGARLASFLGVSAAAVSEMLHRLEREGLVDFDTRKEVRLTGSGKQAAARVIRRHRLAERMLVDLLGYEWWKTHEEAERIEHAMSEEMEERLARVLGDPQTCPHGNPMPGVLGRPTKPLGDTRRGSVRARTGIPRVPRLAGAAPGRGRPRARADQFRAARRDRRQRAHDTRRLRPEGVGARVKSDPAIYVSEGEPGYWLAHVPVLRGCIGTGKTRDDAISNARRAFRAYLELLQARGVSIEHWKELDPERFPVKDMPADRVVPEDVGPLAEHELRDFLHQMEASRSALLSLVRDLSPDELERKPAPEMWSIREALDHMMETEVALLSRLEKWPTDHFNTFQAVHRMAFQRFTVMEPEDTALDHEVLGRRFTTRKVMRRILEHEFEHYVHIKEILAALEVAPARA
jgi:Mn-dependent DtxR family transcriptional regulator/predicted RNase H-like HicB family nuclease